MKRLKNSLVIILAFLAGSLVSIATTAVLAHGGDTSKIHGCVRNNGLLNGFVRIVGANDNCNNNETALDWNIQGPQGPAGPPGGTASGSANFGLPFICFGPCYLNSVADKFQGKDFSYMIGQPIFDNVDINGVIFKDAVFYGPRFSGTNLSNADFRSIAIKKGVNIPNPNGGWSIGSGFFNATATNSNFSNAILRETNADATIVDSNFQNANFSDATLPSIQNSQFQNANFTNAVFISVRGNSIFANANFQNANLTDVTFEGVNLDDAQNMDTANRTNTQWINTTCPDGTNSDNNGNTCEGHLTP